MPYIYVSPHLADSKPFGSKQSKDNRFNERVASRMVSTYSRVGCISGPLDFAAAHALTGRAGCVSGASVVAIRLDRFGLRAYGRARATTSMSSVFGAQLLLRRCGIGAVC